jgi:hypothetical protein
MFYTKSFFENHSLWVVKSENHPLKKPEINLTSHETLLRKKPHSVFDLCVKTLPLENDTETNKKVDLVVKTWAALTGGA